MLPPVSMASGWVRFSAQPAADSTLVINGATLTFKASGATGDQANIGTTLGDTVANAVKAMNDSATAGFAALTFAADPPAPVGAPQSADTIYIQDNASGALTKAITFGPVGMTKSAATLTGRHRGRYDHHGGKVGDRRHWRSACHRFPRHPTVSHQG